MAVNLDYEQAGELKIGQVGIANLRIRTLDVERLTQEMRERVTRAPKLFGRAAVILDFGGLSKLPDRSTAQALLAASAGATYVSPFVGRLDDIGETGISLIQELSEVFAIQKIPTKIIAASIRNPIHVIEVAKAGAQIATVPYQVLLQLIKHPLTDAGIAKFLKDWEGLQK